MLAALAQLRSWIHADASLAHLREPLSIVADGVAALEEKLAQLEAALSPPEEPEEEEGGGGDPAPITPAPTKKKSKKAA